jgi:alpha-galactosidase
VVNEGESRYLVDAVHPTVPVPAHATELLTFDGRWTREFHHVRRDWATGTWLSESRAGRTSHEHQPLLFAGTPGFGEWHGEVWGMHVAWSGNHTMLAEALPDGRRYLQGGELLHPGEVSLEPGGSYASPIVLCTYAVNGLTPASWGYHRHARHLPARPRSPRPVLLTTWEAVYFDHDTDRLKELASVAAAVGIERFVLDDGWFGSRRDDHRGLGDWWVSPEVYPNGLAPLIEHVRSLGMEFGIWVEPEMVNPDSDLYRAHPEWALVTDGYDPVLARHQLVLNLAHPDAFAHVLGQLDALLRDHDVAYVKWDMNRNHVQGSGVRGTAGTHEQTLAFYRLLDALRERHPSVEFESCASGGARIDFEVLRRAERVWTSDCNDALERQTIQWGASMLITPELMGAHIGPTRSHTTGRMHSLAFRAVTALLGHLGVEWNVLALDDTERAHLAEVIVLHKRFRDLAHSGDVVRFDPVANGQVAHGQVANGQQPASHVYGVYARDRSEAVVVHAQLTTGISLLPPPVRLPGLDPDARYRVEHVPMPGSAWVWAQSGIELTGAQLATHGIQLPRQHPESGVLLHLVRL